MYIGSVYEGSPGLLTTYCVCDFFCLFEGYPFMTSENMMLHCQKVMKLVKIIADIIS